MTTEAISMFDAQASDYEAPRRRLIPPYDAFYEAAVAALGNMEHEPRRVLDVGAGTGLLAARIAARHPAAEVHLLDGAPAMLAKARAALGDRVELHLGDFAAVLPPGPWDAVVSALAIHHLSDEEKRGLFSRVHSTLVPGGVFVNAEQVAAPTAWLERRYTAWHAREHTASAAEYTAALERMCHDRRASVEDQLDWLREVGFEDADCLWKEHCFAVLFARRAG